MHNITVQVILFAFDCLYYNGTALLKEPLTKARVQGGSHVALSGLG